MNGTAIKKITKNLKVVNDIAERGVKLFEEFNKFLKMMKKRNSCLVSG